MYVSVPTLQLWKCSINYTYCSQNNLNSKLAIYPCRWDARTSIKHHPDKPNCPVICLYSAVIRNLFKQKLTSFVCGEENSTTEFVLTLLNLYIFHTNYCWFKCLYKRKVKNFQVMVSPWNIFEFIYYDKRAHTERIMNSLLSSNTLWTNLSAIMHTTWTVRNKIGDRIAINEILDLMGRESDGFHINRKISLSEIQF